MTSEELRIARLFSEYSHRENQQNHCVPVLDTFEDPMDNRLAYIVMPFLHNIDRPSFEFVTDIADMVDQLLEVRLTVLSFFVVRMTENWRK